MIREKELINKSLLFAWSSVMVVLTAAYLLEVIKGERTVLYFAILFTIGLAPLITAWVLYSKNREHKLIQQLTAYGYTAFYIGALMTGDTALVFVYIFPIVSLVLICNNLKLLRNFAILNITVNVASIVYRVIALHENTVDHIADKEIQIASMLLVLVITYTMSKTSTKINNYNMSVIKESQKQQEELLDEVIKVTVAIHETTEQIYSESQLMTERADTTANAIDEILGGSNQIVTAIQEQQTMTSDIQSVIVDIKDYSEDINKEFSISKDNISKGMENMEELDTYTRNAKESSLAVQNNMDEFSNKAEEAQGIIAIINSIANQTNLLALNASIEAARAGESGKGFAVVANQITELAKKTQDAIENISRIMGELKLDATSASEAVKTMMDVSSKQNELIDETGENFKVIHSSVEQISQNIKMQAMKIDEMNNENVKIIDRIDSISACSQEVTANAESTKAITAGNLETTQLVMELLEGTTKELRDFEDNYIKK